MADGCPHALTLRVTTAVLTLSQLAAAGDAQALAQLEAMAALLGSSCGGATT